jgi:hypothetical protein
MSTHDFVYQTFLIYIFIKSLVFFPLVWVACVYWWSERSSRTAAAKADSNQEAQQPAGLPALELLPQ